MLGSVDMIFFLEGHTNCRVGTKIRVGRVSGNTDIILGLMKIIQDDFRFVHEVSIIYLILKTMIPTSSF